jgi:hypothetical protein
MTDPQDKPLTDEELDAMAKRAEKATPGAWRCFWNRNLAFVESDTRMVVDVASANDECLECGSRGGGIANWDDAQFIAHSRTDIGRLIRDLREARREADTAKQAVGALRFCAKHKQHLSPLECERLADIIEEAARSKT